MENIATWISSFVELGFPVAVAVYLLIEQGRQQERFRQKLIEVKLGLYLILAKLEATDEYETAIKAYRQRINDKESLDE